MDLFRFISRNIDLSKMQANSKQKLIDHILSTFEDKNSREQILHSPGFLTRLRQQDRSSTAVLDQKVAEYFPNYYANEYKLETTEDREKDMPVFIDKYVAQVNQRNATQGVDGHYIGYESGLSTIRAILVYDKYEYDAALMDSVIKIAAESLLISKETAINKIDAVSLLLSIVIIYLSDYTRNSGIYLEL